MRDIGGVIESACTFLLNYARTKDGFYPQQVGIEEKPVTPTTAVAILALYKTKKLAEHDYNTYIHMLLNLKDRTEKSFCVNEGLSSWATAKALITLLSVDPNVVCNEDILALIKLQNEDGGWGYRPGYISRPFYTYFATKALILYLNANDLKRRNIKTEMIEAVEKSLKKANKFLQKIQLNDVWPRETGDKRPCPVATVMALGSLKLIQQYFKSEVRNADIFETSYLFIQKLTKVKEWDRYGFGESGVAFYVQPAPVDVIPVILEIYGKCEIALYLVRWLIKNCKEYKGTLGWCPLACKENENPYVWTTANAILSLQEWLNASMKSSFYKAEPNKVREFLDIEAETLGAKIVDSYHIWLLIPFFVIAVIVATLLRGLGLRYVISFCALILWQLWEFCKKGRFGGYLLGELYKFITNIMNKL